MEALFKGAGVALITPFHEDKSINFEAMEQMLEDQIKGGTDAIIVCGTTGEPATMTEEEKMSVIRFAVEKVANRIPVIAGTGSNCTQNVIDMSLRAREAGVDGLLIVTPFYNKATQNGLYEHYKAIASAVDLPIIMYNVPSRTGCNILPQTAAKLGMEFENIVGVKEASGNISQVAELVAAAKGSLYVYSGNDDQVVPLLSLGGVGVISVMANVAPKDTHDMVWEYLNGNTARALELQLKYLNLIGALFCEVNPIPVKWAANCMGYQAGGLRLPLTELQEEHKIVVEKAMKEVGLI